MNERAGFTGRKKFARLVCAIWYSREVDSSSGSPSGFPLLFAVKSSSLEMGLAVSGGLPGASEKSACAASGPKARSIPAQAKTGVPSECLLLDGVEKAWVKMPNSHRGLKARPSSATP